MVNPENAHWQALKWILRYIKGSLSKVVIYGGVRGDDNKVEIEGFVDSDYARYIDTRKSLPEYVFIIYLV